MSCRAWHERIALSLYGELDGVEARELEAHLGGCSACREHAAALAGTVDLIRRESPPLPGTVRVTPPAARRGGWRIAAAAAALLAIAIGLRYATRPSVPQVVPDPGPVEPTQTATTAAVEPLPDPALPLTVAQEDRLIRAAVGADPVAAVDAIERLGTAGSRRCRAALRRALAVRVTRPAAFRALRACGDLDLARDVIPALADPGLRREAGEILAGARTAKTFELLLAAVAAGNADAAAPCRSFPASAALPPLLAALDDPARRAAATALLLTTDGDAVRGALVQRCAEDPALRAAAIGCAAADPADPGHARFLALALASPDLSPEAAEAVAGVPVRLLRPGLEAALRDPAARPALVDFLAARASEPAARDLLVVALDGPEVRPGAARALLARGDLRPVRILLEAADQEALAALEALPESARRRELERGLRSPRLRQGALLAVTSGDDALWNQIVPLLRDASVRTGAAEALARAGAGRAIPYLIPYVSASGEGARVRDALVSLAGFDAGEKPEQWSRWWNTHRRD